MDTMLIILLFLNAAFNVIVWPPFLRRVRQDERAFDAQGKATRFYTVHLILIIVALCLGVASFVAALAALLV
ncbi:hypothetical protein EII31_04475 [Leucobacter sp. OH2974_COT-288]|nr:hypothetical protein EII31_04475 [Leucobacter sp. OH2974_COT-288]